MPVTIQDVLNQRAYILEVIKSYGFRNPRIVRLAAPNDKELHILVDEEASASLSLQNTLGDDLQFKLNCIVFIDRYVDLMIFEIKQVYPFPEDGQQLLHDFAGIEFKQGNQEYLRMKI
jgi:hypothetical protein